MMFKDLIEEELNTSNTENGAIGYKTTGSKYADIYFKISSYRNLSDEEIKSDFLEAYIENKELTLKLLFHVRDIRQGLGERRLFRVAFRSILGYDTAVAVKLLYYISEYGRWDDLIFMLGNWVDVNTEVLDTIILQLVSDVSNVRANHGDVSLLGKWLPNIKSKNPKKREQAKMIANVMNWDEKTYRSVKAELNRHINTVEVKMSSGNFDKIDYETVPSKANLKYKNAFLRNDEERRRTYLDSLEKGEVKINSSVAFPHEIVHKYRNETFVWTSLISDIDTTLEQMWKSLPKVNLENAIVVADGSGSMLSMISGTNITAWTVAHALAIYFAENIQGEFNNNYITFSNCPELVKFNDEMSLRDKLAVATKYNALSSTNIERVFDLILDTAVENKIKQSELPRNILILSDMEFDQGANVKGGKSLFDNMSLKYNEQGYTLPKLTFWNILSRTNAIPMIRNEMGVNLVSGFSPNVMKMVLANETDPHKALLGVLLGERYEVIKVYGDDN